MAPNPKVKKAFNAMKAIGISEVKVKPVLKKLLKLYEKNWEMIEMDNYRALADAIFEEQEAEEVQEKKGKKKKNVEPEEDMAEEEEEASIEPEQPLKRLRRGGPSSSPLNNSGPVLDSTLTKKPKFDSEETLPLSLSAQSSSPRHVVVHAKYQPAEAGIILSPKQKSFSSQALIIPKDEPFTDDMPLNVIYPEIAMEKTSSQETPPRTQGAETGDKVDGDAEPSLAETTSDHELATMPTESPSIEIASSPLGEVKISLSCSPTVGGWNRHLPTLEELRRSMEEKCLRSYKILDPNFNVLNLMNDMCTCFLELATNSSNQSPERLTYITPNLDLWKRSAAREAAFGGGIKGTIHMVPTASNGQILDGFAEKSSELDGFAEKDDEKSNKETDVSESLGLVVVPECQITADEWRSLDGFHDITKGEEKVEISWVNEVNSALPPPFYYIPQSLIFQNAPVSFTLSKIGDEHCCSSCFGDCLASPIPCACACQTGGFVYTTSGLLKEDFLEECISMARDPQQQSLQTCKECPLEKAKKEEILEPCKGHLKRKLIIECWSKCGCNKKCGNRVVQRGVQNRLQVFFTAEGKGWGLRTLEKLPKGAFVCEFAGEILTISELYLRISEKHIFPVILDAYWGSDEVAKDERALCLDAMRYGNIAKFLNHRCLDANLIEVPVKVETPEHHYYHLAFFTTREIDAMEELTWDYGIDFDDHDFPIKTFQCLCGSKFCRNMKRANRAKSAKNGR